MIKHSTKYHLKQLDKIAKTGIVPDEYKNVFKGIKDPPVYIRKAQRDIDRIDNEIHEEHIKNGEKKDITCKICNPTGRRRKRKKKGDE